MQRRGFFSILILIVCAALFFVGTGCEDDDTDIPDINDYESADRNTSGAGTSDTVTTVDTSEATVEEEASLSISPSSATLENDGDMASFTASGGSSPYTWSVQDVFRGSVVDSGGASAAYQRSAAGDNAVIVEDATGEKAFAIVDQP